MKNFEARGAMHSGVAGMGASRGFTAGSAAAREQGRATRFVAARMVKLRAVPDRTGHVLAKLPVNTPVRILKADAVPQGWLAVKLSTEPPLFGYIGAAFLSLKPQDARALAKRHDAPAGASDARAKFFSGEGTRSWNVYNRISGARHVIALRWQRSQLRFAVVEQARGVGKKNGRA